MPDLITSILVPAAAALEAHGGGHDRQRDGGRNEAEEVGVRSADRSPIPQSPNSSNPPINPPITNLPIPNQSSISNRPITQF
jgi:hypothetical protein